jgi:hypothetical protein
MHNFDELVYRGSVFTLNALEEVNSKVIEELVDDKFVLNCAELIEQVSIEMRNKFPNYCL